MKICRYYFIMDYGSSAMIVIFGSLCLSQVVLAQSSFPIPCPPPFPDFEAIFARTLKLNYRFREVKLQLQAQFNRRPNCSCSPELMSNIKGINDARCTRTTSVDRVCPSTSTAEPTRPSTSIEQTSSVRPIQSSPTTVRYMTGDGTSVSGAGSGGGGVSRSRRPTTTAPVVGTRKTSSFDGVNVINLDTTTLAGTPVPSAKPVTTNRDERFTIVIIAVGAGALLLIFLIGIVFICRRHLCAASGVQDAHLRREKARRLRSDCQPISAISRGDTFEDSYAPSMISSVGSVGSANGDYRRSYVTNGRKWRPDFDSETASEKSLADTKYILLREDSSASAISFSNHYNTLRTIDHPHALLMGGFGESSTDVTLPRVSRKKRFAGGDGHDGARSENGDISLDSIEDPMAVMPNNNALRRKHSKDSLNSIEIYDRVTRPRSFFINGYATGQGLPSMSSPRQKSRSLYGKRHEHAERNRAPPDLTGHVSPRVVAVTQEKPLAAGKAGVVNMSYQPDGPAAAPPADIAAPATSTDSETNWQDKVLEELSNVTGATAADTEESEDEVDGQYDSLVNDKTAHMFVYENKALTNSSQQLDPPSDFRDSKDSEISVAIVQPLKHDLPIRSTSGSSQEDGASPSASPSSSKPPPPPVAKKPQNSFVRQASGEAIANGVPETPMVNGVANGHEPLCNGVGSEHSNDDIAGGGGGSSGRSVGRVKRFISEIQQKDSGLKPSMHVQPQRYGDTRL